MTSDHLITFEVFTRQLKSFVKKSTLKKEVVEHIVQGIDVLGCKFLVERYQDDKPALAQDLLKQLLDKKYDLFFERFPHESIEHRENISMALIAKNIERAIESNEVWYSGNMGDTK